ncbi:MAG: GTPase ObgE [bacterium]|nr:GTPase ObgE [bacterium]
MFYDSVRIKVTAGVGGNGCVHFNKDIYNPKGVPAGGCGGNGGSVYIISTEEKNTFVDLVTRKSFRASNGGNGGKNMKHGRNGEDLEIFVPIGTVIFNDETGELIADLDKSGLKIKIVSGGNGGAGNSAFVSDKFRFPNLALKGVPGDELVIRLELKLLADIAIIGFPNAGKSTLISKLSSAKPKIADYPFTSLTPNLGVVKYQEYKSFVIADIPGLIQGASDGAGLGTKFLKHVERTKIICHLLDLSCVLEGRGPLTEYAVVREELINYKKELAELPEIVVGNKIDIPDARAAGKEVEDYFNEKKIPFLMISAVTGEGILPLKRKLGEIFEDVNKKPKQTSQSGKDLILIKVEPEKDFTIEVDEDGYYHISCKALSKLIKQIDFKQRDALMFFNSQLKKLKIDESLRNHGIQEGDTVIVDDFEFEYHSD